MKTHNITDDLYRGFVREITREMMKANFKPDYIVGITPNGNYAATMLGCYFERPVYGLSATIQPHDDSGRESNCWMAEDAYYGKNILVVDEKIDASTIDFIKKDWQSACSPSDPIWGSLWGNNVRFATVTENIQLAYDMDFSGFQHGNDDTVIFDYKQFWR